MPIQCTRKHCLQHEHIYLIIACLRSVAEFLYSVLIRNAYRPNIACYSILVFILLVLWSASKNSSEELAWDFCGFYIAIESAEKLVVAPTICCAFCWYLHELCGHFRNRRPVPSRWCRRRSSRRRKRSLFQNRGDLLKMVSLYEWCGTQPC